MTDARRILITGTTGFLGAHAVDAFLQAGWDVVTHSRRPRSAHAATEHLTSDLLDPDAASDLMNKVRPTHLLHLAWRPVHGDVYSAVDNFVWVDASVRLAKAFWQSGGKRFIGCGTCVEYDTTEHPLREDDEATGALCEYARAKVMLLQTLQEMSQPPERSFAWGRVFFAYGPGEWKHRLTPSVVIPLLRNRHAETTHGNQERDFIYAGDVANAFVALAASEAQGVANIATGRALKIRELVQSVANHLERPHLLRIGALAAREGEAPRIVADVSRLADEFGFRARTSLSAGIAATIAWHKRFLSQAWVLFGMLLG